jgi:hypothetical protein
LVNVNNHYIPYSHNNYNTNHVNDSLVPRTILVPVNNVNFNINQIMNYSSSLGESTMNLDFPYPIGVGFINTDFLLTGASTC